MLIFIIAVASECPITITQGKIINFGKKTIVSQGRVDPSWNSLADLAYISGDDQNLEYFYLISESKESLDDKLVFV